MSSHGEPTAAPRPHAPAVAKNGAHAVFQTLLSWEVDRIFICPGSTEAAFLDASLDYPQIELVLTAHESISVAMADGYARATGLPGIVYVHTHLGLANGLAHLYCASLERSPVVVIAGLKARALHGSDGFTTTSDIRSLPRQFVKWDWQTLRLEEIATDLDRALRIAVARPTGPTFVAFPQDLLEGEGEVPVPIRPPRTVDRIASPDPKLLDEAASLLTKATCPVVVLGGSATWPELAPEAERLSEATGAVLLLEDKRSITAVAALRPLTGYAGSCDRTPASLWDADVVLLAGARTPLRFEATGAPAFPAAIRLHLSDDPNEISKGPSHVIPMVGDVREGLQALASKCELLARCKGTKTADSSLRARAVAEYESRLDVPRATDHPCSFSPISVPELMRILVEVAPVGALFVDDSVTSKGVVIETVLRPNSGMAYLTTAGGSLGWGMAAAAGAAQAKPQTPVIAVVGDGVFHFGVQALLTVAQQHIPITYVVINNQGYAAVKAALRRYDGNAMKSGFFPAADLSSQDVTTIARGYGVEAHRTDTLEKLRTLLDLACSQEGPILIEVVTDPDDFGP